MKNKSKNKKNIAIIIALIVILLIGSGVLFLNLIFKNNNIKLYEVGKDIEAGEYVLYGDGVYEILNSKPNYGYYAVCSKKDCDKNNIGSIIVNDNVFGKAYVIVEDGQFLKTKHMKLTKIEDYNPELISSITIDNPLEFNDYYKVGKDISSGTYELVGNKFTYEICSKPSCNISLNENEDEVITNEYTEDNDGSIKITLEDGQYFVIASVGSLKMTKIGD